MRFKKDQRTLNTDDFLRPIQSRFDHLSDPHKKVEAKALLAELCFARKTVLNAFAHADEISEDEIAGEIEHAIAVVRHFEAFLAAIRKSDFTKSISQANPTVPQLLMLARKKAGQGDRAAAAYSIKQATELLVAEFAESRGIKIPFTRNPSFGELFRAVFPEDAMDTKEKRAFHRLIPYLFGSYDPKDFKPELFEEAVRLIFCTGYGQLLSLLNRRASQVNP